MHKKTTEQIYDQIAKSYESNYSDDRVGKSVEAENFFIQELMPYQGLGTVLDCGCGTGMFLNVTHQAAVCGLNYLLNVNVNM